jgi:hypothetical protein
MERIGGERCLGSYCLFTPYQWRHRGSPIELGITDKDYIRGMKLVQLIQAPFPRSSHCMSPIGLYRLLEYRDAGRVDKKHSKHPHGQDHCSCGGSGGVI